MADRVGELRVTAAFIFFDLGVVLDSHFLRVFLLVTTAIFNHFEPESKALAFVFITAIIKTALHGLVRFGRVNG